MMSTSQTVVWPSDWGILGTGTPLAGEARPIWPTPPLSPRPRSCMCGGLTKLFSEKRGEAE